MTRCIFLYPLFFFTLLFASISAQALENKVALVMGNSQYIDVEPLANPVNDARAIASTLRQLDFKVHEHLDINRKEMRQVLRGFKRDLKPGSIAVVYYAGHGIQVGRENYLLPVDTDISEEYEIPDEGLSLSAVLRALRSADTSLAMVMLDACRNNPFERRIRGASRSTGESGQGLAAIDAVRGTLLSFATQPGNVAVDGGGDHSPYTEALLSFLMEPGLSVQSMFNQVGLKVLQTTHHRQEPWLSISPIPKFCFGGCERSNQLTVEDGIAAQQQIFQFRRLFEARNLAGIEAITELDQDQRQQLQYIFDRYQNLVVMIRDLKVNKQQGQVTAIAEIEEATNTEGHRVIPAENWRKLPITLKKQGHQWSKLSWN